MAAATDGSVWVGTDNGLYRFAHGMRRTWARSICRVEAWSPSTATPRGGCGSRPGAGDSAVSTAAISSVDSDRTPVNVRWPDHRSRRYLWLCDLERGLFTWDGRTLDASRPPSTATRRHSRSSRTAGPHLGGAPRRHNLSSRGWALTAVYRGRRRARQRRDRLLRGRRRLDWAGSRNGLVRFRNGRIDSVALDRGLPGHTVIAITGDSGGESLAWSRARASHGCNR